ncbi:MAG: glycosyltransferase [Planctomycetota bacterium]
MIDVMIIAFNEALNLPHCLNSVRGWTNRVFVIDSGSTDGTQDIAREYGAEVVHHDWEGYARQKNWGLNNLPFESEWLLILDADELVTPELRTELERITSKPADDTPENGFHINRLTYYLGKPIRHCGFFPSWNLRLFKRGAAHYEDRVVHEHMICPDPVGYLKPPMIHEDRRGIEHYVAKHNRYSTLEAGAIFAEQHEVARGIAPQASISRETAIRRWLKRNVMPRVPMPGFWRFVYMYFVRFGFLDGLTGIEFCRFIAGYDALVSLKLRELRRLEKSGDLERIRQHAEELPGLAVAEGQLHVTDAHAGVTGKQRPKSPEPIPDPEQLRPEASPWSFKEKVFRALWMTAGKPIFRLSFHNWYAYRAGLLRLFGARIGRGVRLRPTVNVEIPWNLDIRDGATVGDYAILYGLGKITIGERTIVSQYAHLCAGTHDFTDRRFPLIRDSIEIGADAWVGADAFVGPQVHVGRLAVLGARSSTYRDLEPAMVYVGNPAKPLKKRELQ